MQIQKDQDELRVEQDKRESRESGNDFRFRRRMLLISLTKRATWQDHMENLTAALDILNKNSKAKKALSKSETEIIRAALVQYKAIEQAFREAGEHTRVLFHILDEAAKLYKAGKRSHARMLDWTTGKRGKTEDHASIEATYIFQTGMGVSKIDAVNNIVKLFHLTSPNAVIEILKQSKKRMPSLSLPNNWPKIK